jgi:hypothetical protein
MIKFDPHKDNPERIDTADPIFAAIEAYKREDRRLIDCYGRESTEEAARACRKHSRTTPIGKIIPTTVAGAAALLDLYCKWEPWKNGDLAWTPRAVKNVLVALKRLALEERS